MAARSLLRDVSHHPVGGGLPLPPVFGIFPVNAGILPCGSARPTDIMVIEGRAGQETRPYGAISALSDAMATAATEPRLSLRNQTGLLKTP